MSSETFLKCNNRVFSLAIDRFLFVGNTRKQMNKYHAGRPKIERDHDQRKYSNGHHITHRWRVIEKIENNNAADQHNPYCKGV